MTGINHDTKKLNYKDDFSEMFVKLIDAMVDYEHFSREALVDALCRLARSFRPTKVVTEFYKSVMDEKDGEGETLCDFDEGPADIVVLKKRNHLKNRSHSSINGICCQGYGTFKQGRRAAA